MTHSNITALRTYISHLSPANFEIALAAAPTDQLHLYADEIATRTGTPITTDPSSNRYRTHLSQAAEEYTVAATNPDPDTCLTITCNTLLNRYREACIPPADRTHTLGRSTTRVHPRGINRALFDALTTKPPRLTGPLTTEQAHALIGPRAQLLAAVGDGHNERQWAHAVRDASHTDHAIRILTGTATDTVTTILDTLTATALTRQQQMANTLVDTLKLRDPEHWPTLDDPRLTDTVRIDLVVTAPTWITAPLAALWNIDI